MERCQMFLLRCSKWIQHHSGRFRTLPAEFQNFFPSEKNAFSVVYFWSKSPYYRQFKIDVIHICLLKIHILHKKNTTFSHYEQICTEMQNNCGVHEGTWCANISWRREKSLGKILLLHGFRLIRTVSP